MQVSMHIDSSAKIMEITYYCGITPESLVATDSFAGQVEYQEVLTGYGFHYVFAKTPRLHGPDTSFVKLLEEFIYGNAYGMQIFRGFYRWLPFVERVGGIYTVTAKKFVLFFKEGLCRTQRTKGRTD